jgi:hypothetical protein
MPGGWHRVPPSRRCADRRTGAPGRSWEGMPGSNTMASLPRPGHPRRKGSCADPRGQAAMHHHDVALAVAITNSTRPAPRRSGGGPAPAGKADLASLRQDIAALTLIPDLRRLRPAHRSAAHSPRLPRVAAGLAAHTGNPFGNPVVVTEPPAMPLPGRRTLRDLRRCSKAPPGGRVVSHF